MLSPAWPTISLHRPSLRTSWSAKAAVPPAEAISVATVLPCEALLSVRDVRMHFPVTRGIIFQKKIGAVRAVDGVTFDLATRDHSATGNTESIGDRLAALVSSREVAPS